MEKNKDYYEKLDKRTKEYKDYKKRLESAIEKGQAEATQGLGDKIEEITTKTGIKKAVKKIFGDDCGCDERKAKFNRYRRGFPVTGCFTEEQWNKWTDFREAKTNKLSYNDEMLIIELLLTLFSRKLKRQSCCYEQWIDMINQIYENY